MQTQTQSNTMWLGIQRRAAQRPIKKKKYPCMTTIHCYNANDRTTTIRSMGIDASRSLCKDGRKEGTVPGALLARLLRFDRSWTLVYARGLLSSDRSRAAEVLLFWCRCNSRTVYTRLEYTRHPIRKHSPAVVIVHV